MGAMASRMTSLTIVYSNVYSGADLKRLFRRRSKETSKLRVTAARTGEVPAQMASNVENAVTGYLCLYVWLMKKNTINLFCCPQD